MGWVWTVDYIYRVIDCFTYNGFYIQYNEQELHKTANRRRCAGTHYVDSLMLLVKKTEVAGVIEPL